MAIVTDGLVLYFHGACGKNNPATRVWKDLSGNGNDGELVNFGYTEGSGWVDGGLKFDGVDDYVQLPDLNLNPEKFTIQVDNKIRAFNGDKVMTENGDEWGRNLLRNSNFNSGFEYWVVLGRISIIAGEGVLIESVAGRSDYIQNTTLIPKGEYTVQIKYRVIEGQAPYLWETNGTDMKLPQGPYIFEIGDNEWQTATFPVIVNSESRFYAIRYAQASPADHLEGKTLIKWIKLEKGSQATPWTPAPEDITETNIINHTTPFVENNTIHTLRFYNRALTDEEILQNYQAGYEWTPQIGKREVTTTMKPITASLSRKGKGKRELISTMKPITTSLERKGKGKREVISTMKPITSELNRKGVGRREVITTMQPIISSISKKLPPIHANITAKERTPNITTRERIPKLEVD